MDSLSPCVGICSLEDDICIGCGRSSAEIFQAGIDAGYPAPTRLVIYHICRAEEWRAAQAAGVYRGSSQDIADGFIHFSDQNQVKASAAKHRAGQSGLLLIGCDPDRIGPGLKWEVSRGGALFPHCYGPLPMASVVSVVELPLGPDGLHRFPF